MPHHAEVQTYDMPDEKHGRPTGAIGLKTFCAVWKSTRELGCRVGDLKTLRYRADAATEITSRRWRGAPKVDFHTGVASTALRTASGIRS